MWRRASQNSVQDSRELTVNIQPPGEERGKNSFVSKSWYRRESMMLWKYVHLPDPRFPPLSTAVVLGVLVNANYIFLGIRGKPWSRSSSLPPWGGARLHRDNGRRAEAGPWPGGCLELVWGWDLGYLFFAEWGHPFPSVGTGPLRSNVDMICVSLSAAAPKRDITLPSGLASSFAWYIFSYCSPVQQSFWICWAFALIHWRVCSSRNHWELWLLTRAKDYF